MFGSYFIEFLHSATHVLKPGEKSQSVKLYLLAGAFVYLTLSIAAHIFVKPNSDFCISLSFNYQADMVEKACILTTFFLNLIFQFIMILYAIRITIIVKEVEKNIKKTRKKTWIATMYLVITLNCTGGLIAEGIAVLTAFRTVFVQDWIFLVLSVFPVIPYPALMK